MGNNGTYNGKIQKLTFKYFSSKTVGAEDSKLGEMVEDNFEN